MSEPACGTGSLVFRCNITVIPVLRTAEVIITSIKTRSDGQNLIWTCATNDFEGNNELFHRSFIQLKISRSLFDLSGRQFVPSHISLSLGRVSFSYFLTFEFHLLLKVVQWSTSSSQFSPNHQPSQAYFIRNDFFQEELSSPRLASCTLLVLISCREIHDQSDDSS